MSQNKNDSKLVKIEIKYFTEETAKDPFQTDSIKFTNEGLKSLKEICSDPTNAIVLAVQLALKLKRFDAAAAGDFTIETKNKKGDLKVPDWK